MAQLRKIWDTFGKYWISVTTVKNGKTLNSNYRQQIHYTLNCDVFTHKKSSCQWQPAWWYLHKRHISVQINGCMTQMKLFEMLYSCQETVHCKALHSCNNCQRSDIQGHW